MSSSTGGWKSNCQHGWFLLWAVRDDVFPASFLISGSLRHHRLACRWRPAPRVFISSSHCRGLWFPNFPSYKFSSVQSLSGVQLFVTPWTAACQASLSITNSWSFLKLMSIESVIPSNYLSLCHPLLLLPSIFPSTRVFSNESLLIRTPGKLD